MLCAICQTPAQLIDVVDFNKNCEELKGTFLPVSGIPVYYAQCPYCLFTFAPEFSSWSEQDFVEKIYNEGYAEVDPSYLEARPAENLSLLRHLLGAHKKNIRHLDYGGGNGRLSQLLRQDGWDSRSFDPFVNSDTQVSDLGQFDLVTAFEVFEHVPDPNVLMTTLAELTHANSVILFSTLVSDGRIERNQRLSWWYAAPRNGHISLFSRQSLVALGSKYQWNSASFNDGLHCYCREVPIWAQHLFRS